MPVAAEEDRHSNSARLVVRLSLPQHGARHRGGGPAPCWQAAPGPAWQRLRFAVTHRDCGHRDFKPRPGTPSLALTVPTRLGLRQCRGQWPLSLRVTGIPTRLGLLSHCHCPSLEPRTTAAARPLAGRRLLARRCPLTPSRTTVSRPTTAVRALHSVAAAQSCRHSL